MNKLIKPKFKLGDTVYFKNEYSFNPCYKAITICKIEAIHIIKGRELYYNPNERSEPEELNYICYHLTGHNTQMRENELISYDYQRM